MILDISAKYARLAFYFQQQANSIDGRNWRYRCMRIEPHPKGAVIVATNGYWMFVGVDEEGECSEPVNLKLSVRMHCAMKPAIFAGMRLRARKGELLLIRNKLVVDRQSDDWLFPDQSYPDWRHIMPTDLSDLNIHFPAVLNARVLGQIGNLANDVPDLTETVFLGHNDDPTRNCFAYFPGDPSIMMAMATMYDQEHRSPYTPPGDDWISNFGLVGQRINDDL